MTTPPISKEHAVTISELRDKPTVIFSPELWERAATVDQDVATPVIEPGSVDGEAADAASVRTVDWFTLLHPRTWRA